MQKPSDLDESWAQKGLGASPKWATFFFFETDLNGTTFQRMGIVFRVASQRQS